MNLKDGVNIGTTILDCKIIGDCVEHIETAGTNGFLPFRASLLVCLFAAIFSSNSFAAVAPEKPAKANIENTVIPPNPPQWSQQVYLKRAFAAADIRRWNTAKRLARKIRSPMAHKILHWMRITGRGAPKSYQEIVAFMRQNPRWPRIIRLRYRAETRLPAMKPKQLLAWFKIHPPLSSVTKFRYAAALRATGKKKQALKIFRTTWIEGKFSKPKRLWILKR